MAKATTQSIEPLIADLANGWLKAYKLDYKLEQESLNTEIDTALNEYFSKSGGKGGNRPDTKILLQDKSLNFYPILIEYKGYKDKLVKLDANGQVENRTAKNEPILKNINAYAVNGAVHYGKIDLDFMNDFISAIIKLAIQDVVIYTDEKVKVTKQLIDARKDTNAGILNQPFTYEDVLEHDTLMVAEESLYNK